MEFHTCKNCTLIDEVIGNQILKYSTLSEENISLHKALITLRNVIIELNNETANLRDGLIGERDRNLQLYMELQANNLRIQEHIESPCTKTTKKTDPNSSMQEKLEHVPLSQYNDILNLLHKQKEDYTNDLNLFKTLSNRQILKLKEEINNMQEHSAVILQMNELLRSDLFTEKKENIKFRKFLHNTIENIQVVNTKYVENVKKEILTETTSLVTVQNRKALALLKNDLEERDKLVSKLYQQQIHLEKYGSKRENEHLKQREKYKKVVEELQKQLKAAKEKYCYLDKRRALEAEGFFTDVAHIHKEINKIKNNLKSRTICRSCCNVDKLMNSVNGVEGKVKFCYSR